MEPELRFAPSGTAVTKLRLVASSRKKDENGEWVDDKTLWMGVTVFKQLAEHVAESVAKGDLVVVTGRLQTDEWTTDAGEKRSAVAMIADTVSVSLQFRTVPHSGDAKAASASSASSSESPSAAVPDNDEPPF
jgi:single-strand DNA-binding protein